MEKRFLLPTPPGELLDKLSILLLKRQALNTRKTASPLQVVVEAQIADILAVVESPGGFAADPYLGFLAVLTDSDPSTTWHKSSYCQLEYNAIMLYTVNKQLWTVEDALRICEKEGRFDDFFVELARSVYKLNTERSKYKSAINLVLGAAEEPKVYST